MSLLGNISGLFKKESVYFFTLHKCASTLFSNFALQRFQGLKHVDHMAAMYAGKAGPFRFEKRGYVYGPLRLSQRGPIDAYQEMLAKITTPEYLRRKKSIFFVRDPRDILVSQYHSFGFTHGFSPVPEIRAAQEKHRSKIVSRTIDEYVLWVAPRIKWAFELIRRMHSSARNSTLLRYEDMISDWEHFSSELLSRVEMAEGDLLELKARSRPRDRVEIGSHRRNGAAGQYKTDLKPETVIELNTILRPELENFDYVI